MTGYEIRFVPRQDTAVMHLRCGLHEISTVMGEAFGKVFEAVTRAGGTPAGPVFARYFEFDEDIVDFECGIAVTAPFTGDDGVKASEIGGCEAAVAMHIGSYDTLNETYDALQAWIEAQGRTPSPVMWEVYLTDPDQEPDPMRWQTEVYWPVE